MLILRTASDLFGLVGDRFHVEKEDGFLEAIQECDNNYALRGLSYSFRSFIFWLFYVYIKGFLRIGLNFFIGFGYFARQYANAIYRVAGEVLDASALSGTCPSSQVIFNPSWH